MALHGECLFWERCGHVRQTIRNRNQIPKTRFRQKSAKEQPKDVDQYLSSIYRRKLRGQQLKGKIVAALFHAFSYTCQRIFTHFQNCGPKIVLRLHCHFRGLSTLSTQKRPTILHVSCCTFVLLRIYSWVAKALPICRIEKPRKSDNKREIGQRQRITQKRPDVHKIVLSIKLRPPPPPPRGKSVNFEDSMLICAVFPHFGLCFGGGGGKNQILRTRISWTPRLF